LGTEGINTDLGAHFFGFIFGFMIGLIIEHVIENQGRPGKALNSVLASISAFIVLFAWWLAVTSG
jgi:multisubunit Na+/H+ antiporter MnhE subunit